MNTDRMVIYGSRRYGLRWRFEINVNRAVFWNNDKPDWLIASRGAMEWIWEHETHQINQYLASLLAEDATCSVNRVAKKLAFSEL